MGGCVSNLHGRDGEDLPHHVIAPETNKKINILGHDPNFPFVPYDHHIAKVMPLFNKSKVLGRGASCEVAMVVRKGDRAQFAMKIMKRNDRWNPILFTKEYELLSKLDHPNIVGYRDCYMDKEHFYFCTELCKGGELFEKIRDMKNFREVEAAFFLSTLISAIEYCHSMNVVHRDLKPENIVFRTPEQKEIVIIDFGDARIIEESEIYEDFVGTAFYLAPESVRERTGAELKKSDMWTIGVIAYVMLTGRPPFYGHDNKQILKKIIKCQVVFPKHKRISSLARDFIKKLLRKEPKDRLSAKECLEHKWLKGEAGTESLGRDLVESLSNFSRASKLKKVLVRMMANQLSKSDKKALRYQFDQMDVKGDGTINQEEIADFLTMKGSRKQEANKAASRIIEKLDQSGDRKISPLEWSDARLSEKFGDDDLIKKQFDNIDENHDGYITKDDLAKLFNWRLTDDLIVEMIEEVDSDKDGRIGYEEFVNAMKEGCFERIVSPRKTLREEMTEVRLEIELERDKSEEIKVD